MQLYFDLDLSILVSSPGTRDPVATLSFKRGDNLTVAVIFSSGVTKQALPDGASGVLGIKAQGDYDGDFLASAVSWTQVGEGADAVYNFALNLDTEGLNDLLGVGADPDLASVVTMLELQFVVGGVVTSSQTIAATIANDVVRGGETGPIVIVAGVPVNAVDGVQASIDWDLTGQGLPPANSTLTVGVRTYTFKASATATGQLGIGADETAQAAIIFAGINGDSHNTAHPDVLATLGGADVQIFARVAGAAGNSIAVTASAYATPSPGHLHDGADAIPATFGFLGSMQVAPGMLYVVSSVTDGVPTWQQVALSDLS